MMIGTRESSTNLPWPGTLVRLRAFLGSRSLKDTWLTFCRRIESLEATLKSFLGSSASQPQSGASNTVPVTKEEPQTAAHVTAQASHDAATSTEPLGDVIPQVLSIDIAQSLLARFKTAMMRHFPFVVIPEAASAQSLLAERPLLLLAIVAAAAYDDLRLQRRLGDDFKRSITQRIFYVEAMSLDTLQALLVHLAWYAALHVEPTLRYLLRCYS